MNINQYDLNVNTDIEQIFSLLATQMVVLVNVAKYQNES